MIAAIRFGYLPPDYDPKTEVFSADLADAMAIRDAEERFNSENDEPISVALIREWIFEGSPRRQAKLATCRRADDSETMLVSYKRLVDYAKAHRAARLTRSQKTVTLDPDTRDSVELLAEYVSERLGFQISSTDAAKLAIQEFLRIEGARREKSKK
jgi:hypothetical protein